MKADGLLTPGRSPPYIGSQRSLVPDLWLEWQDTTLIVDAKYKRHWEELQQNPWGSIADQVREQHRNDLFQVLAYGNLARTERVIVCLAYPCGTTLWKDLHRTNRLLHKAEVSSASRSLHLWLTAIPMGLSSSEVAAPLEQALRGESGP